MIKTRVYYEDTDANGIVYHANYIKFCDRARTEFFFDNNVALKEENEYLVIRDLDAKYYSPAMLGDLLTVTTKIEKLRESSIVLYHEIYKETTTKVFSMRITLVFLNNGRPARMPRKFLDLFKKFNDTKEQ